MIMENDENKKDLKGKRVAKKQARRNSRSSNSNSNIREQDKDVKNSSNLNSNKTVEINERLNQVISNNVVNVSLKSENTVNGERKNKSLKRVCSIYLYYRNYMYEHSHGIFSLRKGYQKCTL